jgi:hypothetical protein
MQIRHLPSVLCLLALLFPPAAALSAQSTDYALDNQPGQQFRLELNSILAAAQSLNSGATAPAAPVAYMVWADTDSGYLKIRNGANTAWITGPRLSDMQAPDAAKLDGAAASAYQLVADMTATATAGKGVLRDAGGRAKVADAAASDDAMALGQFTGAAILSRLLTVDGAGSGLDADKVDGYEVGAASGNIPRSNGALSVNLNADRLDGYHASQTPGADQIPALSATGVLALPSAAHTIGGSAILKASDPSASATPNAIVKRDGSGNVAMPSISAGTTYVLAEAAAVMHPLRWDVDSTQWIGDGVSNYQLHEQLRDTTTYTKVAEAVVPASGYVSTSFWLQYGYGQVHKNGVAVGTALTGGSAPQKRSDASIAVTAGDRLQLYVKTTSATGGSETRYGYFRVMTNTYLPLVTAATGEQYFPR